jgi:DNA-binding transcriptional LysR family regulator
VSQAVKGLENYYGTELVAHATRPIVASEAGAALDARANAALQLVADGLREVAGGSALMPIVRAASAHRLAALAAIVRSGSFAEAARALGMAAPTLHRAARELERVIGSDLFETTSYGVKPTKQAEILANNVGLAFSELQQAAAEIRSLRGDGVGRTVIGAMPLARSHIVPVAVEKFSRGHAAHRVVILEGAYEDLAAGLRRGAIDILIGAARENIDARDVIQEPLFDDRLSIVMRSGHPALARKRLTPQMLTAYPWVAPRAGSPLRRHFEELFEAVGAPVPENIIECNSLGASRVILMNSDRMMLLSDAQIRYEKAAAMLASRPHPAGPRARAIALSSRRSWRPTNAQQNLLAEIRVAAAAR